MQRVVLNGVGYEWVDVLSGVLQGSVLGPVLFIVFVNDLDVNVKGKIFKFADDAKIVGRVGSKEGIYMLREDMVTLFKWSENWQMMFNVSMCSVVGMGFN